MATKHKITFFNESRNTLFTHVNDAPTTDGVVDTGILAMIDAGLDPEKMFDYTIEPVRTTKPSGFIIYRGPSLLDGKPIVVVAITKESKNSKTGNMVQTYIMADNGQSPVESAKDLSDASVCGDCKHRRGMGGSCYVNLGQGPRSVMDGVMRDIYPHALSMARDACVGRKVRLGTYGDPAAVPAQYWEVLLQSASGHTGYTHQWRKGKADHVKQWCMASTDTGAETVVAKKLGWRTFRVRSMAVSEFPNEMICPASEEAGKRLTCSTCMACSGGVDSKKASVTIVVHGSLKKRFDLTVGQ